MTRVVHAVYLSSTVPITVHLHLYKNYSVGVSSAVVVKYTVDHKHSFMHQQSW